jgi:hypothetical protein
LSRDPVRRKLTAARSFLLEKLKSIDFLWQKQSQPGGHVEGTVTTGKRGEDSPERAAMTARTEQPEQDSQDRTARMEKIGKEIQKRAVRKGQTGKDSKERIVRKGQPGQDRTVRTSKF